ncbi:MAG TPA: N-acetylmuramoyl-L-alanine amidase [Acidobacteriaceae bacterium]|nr:N-acetylmuramoyl-L-alanine amidase [Acidobacteriaceae bacterium]
MTGRSYLRSCLAMGAALCLFASIRAEARPAWNRPLQPLSPFEHAERLHTLLENQPEQQRTQRDYERVLDAYRAVYHENPGSSRADASISAVAVLLAEEGRLFRSQKLLHDAIGQYEFLCREYPGSRFRFSALAEEAEIYRTDLNDPVQARATLQEFVRMYPGRPFARQARLELQELRDAELSGRRREHRARSAEAPAAEQSTAQSRPEPKPASSVTVSARGDSMTTPPLRSVSGAPEKTAPPAASQPEPAAPAPAPEFPGGGMVAGPDMGPAGAPSPNRKRLLRATAIRYWSTPAYTRIALDLDDQVQYRTARVLSPDRIYFDLLDVRLSPNLIGKSVVLTDGGFLQRIRAAQYSGNVTRIVLDVGSGTDYSAFFLPNPWRLIIDIRSRKVTVAPKDESAGRTLDPGAHGSSPAAPPALPIVRTVSRSLERTSSHTTPATRRNELDTLFPADSASVAAPDPRFPHAPSSAPQPLRQSLPEPAGSALQPDDASAASLDLPPAGVHSRSGVSRRASSGMRRPSAVTSAESVNPSPMDLPPMREAEPTSDGERSLVRTLGLKIGRIVIDAGHGGHDCGTLGPGGIQEKDITLDVALRLGKLLKQRLGADVIYTRGDDTFIPLETRTAIANQSRADLFISVHANSSSDPGARGVESYYLNFTTSPDALEVAARENAASDGSIHELSDLVKQITLRDKIEESREFATDVQKSLYAGLEDGNPGLKDRGVKKAPFVVLIGAHMPSILAEISFLTNPDDARELRQGRYRQRIAESLYRGVAKYINGLSGIRLAQNAEHSGN